MPVTRRGTRSTTVARNSSAQSQLLTEHFSVTKKTNQTSAKRAKLGGNPDDLPLKKTVSAPEKSKKLPARPPSSCTDVHDFIQHATGGRSNMEQQREEVPEQSQSLVPSVGAVNLNLLAKTPDLTESPSVGSPRKRKGSRALELEEACRAKISTPNSARRKLTFNSVLTSSTTAQHNQCSSPLSVLSPVVLPAKVKVNSDQPKPEQVPKDTSKPDTTEPQITAPKPVESLPKPQSSEIKQKEMQVVTESAKPVVTNKPPLPKLPKKQKIGRVRNLKELQAQLAQFSETAQRLNQYQTEYREGENDIRKVQLSPKKTPTKTPSKDESEASTSYAPAHERYSHLLADKDIGHLPLPINDQLLAEMFRNTDLVCGLMQQRKQIITMDKLRPAVQALTKRDFKMRYLGQFLTMYPEAYSFAVHKAESRFGRTARADEYDFIITPLLDNDLLGQRLPVSSPMKACPSSPARRMPPSPGGIRSGLISPIKSPMKSRTFLHSPIKTPSKMRPLPPALQSTGLEEIELTRLTGTRQMYRLAIFKKRLVERVMHEHDKYLASLSPAVILSPEERAGLKRWHPNFELSSVAQVPVAELPQAPNAKQVKPISVRDLMSEFSKEQLTLPANVTKALIKLDKDVPANASTEPVACPISTSASTSGAKSSALNGVSASLLEKIRAKQAVKEQVSMLRDDTSEKRKLRLSRLPDFIRIIRMTFMACQKTSLPKEEIDRKLKTSYSNLLTKNEIDEHLNVLLEVLPNWLCRTEVHNRGVYIRLLAKHANLQELLDAVEREKKKIP